MNAMEEMFADLAAKLQQGSRAESVVSPETVFQPANLDNRKLVHALAGKLLMPGSCFENLPVFLKLAGLARQGKSCLILPEHYSNFDIPNLFLILEQSGPDAKAASDHIIAIAGVKLNEESLFVRAFTEAYSRLVTYPPRSLDVLRQDSVANTDEISRARIINMAALRKMTRLKHEGYMFLVYPSGTRYRPEDEDSRRGLKEIDSYIKSFDYLLFLGMAGNTLQINPAGDYMGEDLPVKDAVVFMASDVYDAHQFRAGVRSSSNEEDLKQVVADAVMTKLAGLHNQAEAIREKIMRVSK